MCLVQARSVQTDFFISVEKGLPRSSEKSIGANIASSNLAWSSMS